MKRIEIPKNLMIKGMDGVESDHSFRKFLRTALEADEKYGKGLANIRRGMALLKIVKAECKGGELILENADFEDIKTSIDSAQWLTPIIVQMEPFIDAVENAKTFAVKKTPRGDEGKGKGKKKAVKSKA